jgi:hypothetical protein
MHLARTDDRRTGGRLQPGRPLLRHYHLLCQLVAVLSGVVEKQPRNTVLVRVWESRKA